MNTSSFGFSSGDTNSGGTVSSVGLSMPTEYAVANSPVTTSGVLTVSWASQNQNLVLASPNGSSGTPTFRALVLNDMPPEIKVFATSNLFNYYNFI